MPHFVKVNSDSLVIEFWDSPPPVPIGTDGWRNAVVNMPEPIPGKEYLGDWSYDVTQDPVVVSRELKYYTFEEMKNGALGQNENNFNIILDQVQKAPYLLTAEELREIKNKTSNNKIKIQSCETIEQLDALVLEEISIF